MNRSDFLHSTASAVQSYTGYNWTIVALPLMIAMVLVARTFQTNKLPPGPVGLPILGNLLQLTNRPWLQFTEWTKKYGPMFRINMAGQNIVVIGSHKIATELFDRRSQIYSDRARNIVAGELLCGGLVIAFSQHNDIWKRMRRGAHEVLNKQVARNYFGFHEAESVLLAHQFLKDPAGYDDHLRRASASLIQSIVYGVPPVTDSRDPDIIRVNQFTARGLAAATPGAFLVEYFTWMEYLPRWIAGWRRWAEDWFARDSKFFEKLFADAKARVKSGDETPSVAAMLVNDQRNLTDIETVWLPANLHAAGSETTSAQMAWFVLAMVLYPDIQKRAQEEIDSVIGWDRPPTFKDYDRLPYVGAIVKEILRWRGVSPIGLPHRLDQDDWYDGYFLPKNTIVIPNVWHLNLDPDVYGPDAEEFKPERYLTADGQPRAPVPDTRDEGHVSYGFGKRICVGRHIANNSIFIEAAVLLWAFNFAPGKDANGNIVLPSTTDCENDSLVIRPLPYACSITPRSPDIESAIAHAMEMHSIVA